MSANYDHLAWKNSKLPADKRAKLLMNAMTLEEKARLLSRHIPPISGENDWHGGVNGNNRLQYPQINYQSGSQGFADNLNHGSTTVWPSVLALS